jgi:PII-like signaling protein
MEILTPRPARKVTIHLNEDTSLRDGFLYSEIFRFLLESGVAGASLIRPDASFGSHHRIHSVDAAPPVSEHLPVRIEFIESAPKVDEILPALCELVTDGLIESHETTIHKSAVERGRI